MADVGVWDQTLAGQNSAIYAYGIVAAELSGTQRAAALAAMASHRVRRDALRAKIAAAGATPTPAAAAYELPFAVPDAGAATKLAALVESRCAGQFAALAGASSGQDRSDAALASQECAIRSVTWSNVAPVWFGNS